MPHVHPARHHAPQLQDAFRLVLGEAGADFNGIERAGETITPMIDLWRRPEWAFLRGEIPWSAYHEQAAVAAEFGFVGLRNPAGSGLICVITGGEVDNGAAATFRSAVTHGAILATDVDGSEQVVPRDTRLPITGVSRIVKIHGAGVAQIGNDSLYHPVILNGYSRVLVDNPQVLSPGFELRVYHNTVNQAINVNLWGYAYPVSGRALGG